MLLHTTKAFARWSSPGVILGHCQDTCEIRWSDSILASNVWAMLAALKMMDPYKIEIGIIRSLQNLHHCRCYEHPYGRSQRERSQNKPPWSSSCKDA